VARRWSLAVLAVSVAAGVIAGCGSSSQQVANAGSTTAARDTLEWAIPRAPIDLDPLTASDRYSLLVDRQLSEPLIESLSGPYGDARRLPGLALAAHGSANDTVWHLPLRGGIRFQDGSLFTAAAVVANAERWQTTGAGRALLPGLTAADNPRPGLVRLFFDRPTPEVPELLTNPRLAILSPRSLRPHTGAAAIAHDPAHAGTGPFELRVSTENQVVIVQHAGWWGTARGLGPALDQVQFRVIPDANTRVALLRRGEVQIADGLDRSQAQAVDQDPLLVSLHDGGTAIGLERSVRGVDSATEIPPLSDAWLTRIGAG
jgi:peptide/nickel transport system substrate-binding protein